MVQEPLDVLFIALLHKTKEGELIVQKIQVLRKHLEGLDDVSPAG